MSRNNIVDDAFGDISGFLAFRRNPDNTFQPHEETESGHRVADDELMTDNRELDCIEIQSEVEGWSGPETLSDPGSWGTSEGSEIGPVANNTSSRSDGVGGTNVDMKGDVDTENISIGKDSSGCNDSRGENNLVDGSFEEINLVDEITEPVDNILPNENANDGDDNLANENIDNENNNSVNGSVRDSVSGSMAEDADHTDCKDDSIQDSESNYTDELLQDDDNDVINGNSRLEVNNPDLISDPGDDDKEHLNSNSTLENFEENDTSLVNGNDLDADNHSVDTGIQDSDNGILDTNPRKTNGDSRLKKLKKDKDLDDESVVVLPIEDRTPSASTNNNGDVSLDIERDDVDIRDEDTNDEWTVLEVWSCFAMIAGSLPYYISNDGRETNLHRNVLSNILWGFSMILQMIEIVNVIPKMSENFQEKPSGTVFCSLATHFSYALFLILNIWASILKEPSLIKANNTLLALPQGRLSKQSAAKLFVFLFFSAITNTVFYVLYQTKALSGFGILDTNEIMETLECLGKMPLTLSTECTTSDLRSVSNIVWGLIGLVLTAHEIFIKTSISLGILISCGSLMYFTFYVDNMEACHAANMFAQVSQADLNKITNLAEDLSRFIGEVLTGYLIMNATASTIVFYHVFKGGILVFISGLFNNVVIFIGMLLGSVASLRINWIVDQISSNENTHPPNTRPGTAMVMDFFRDMAFRKSVGIGFTGIFVINFKTTFSYIGAIGALIALRL